MIEISKLITDSAKQVLEEKVALPTQVPGFPSYYVANHEDRSVQSHGSVEVDGIFYKVGTLKLS